jgi:hypothetical protein
MSSKKQPKCTKRSSGKGSITKAVDESHKESSIVIDSDDDTAADTSTFCSIDQT